MAAFNSGGASYNERIFKGGGEGESYYEEGRVTSSWQKAVLLFEGRGGERVRGGKGF